MATPKKFVNRDKVSRGPRKFFSARNRGWLTDSCPEPLSPPPAAPPPSAVLGTQLGQAFRVLLLRIVQRRLGLVDGLLPACVLLLPGRLLPGFLALATLALPLVPL